ncbi:MAG: hypothetical protein HKN09_01985 [Saprospiraceae bacterium]|nr:hypothetical protein [Saprospiraceae bacterium]
MASSEYIQIIGDILSGGQSKAKTLKIVEFIGDDPIKFEALMYYFFHDEWRWNQWAAWPLGNIGKAHPALIKPYFKQFVECLKNPSHDAVARNILRILEDFNIPEDYTGPLFDLAFNYLLDTKKPIALRVFSMSVLFNIAKPYPELLAELKVAIEAFLPHGSAGFKSRGKKIIGKINKII